jgi:CubicO group peptidase (beta-lactamase class C family)
MTLDETGTWLEDVLPGLIERGHVPAASVAVLAGGRMVTAATGVLSTSTGVDATIESLFQIGSITKVWTTTLIMQLVDEKLLDLDAPVRTVLTDFALGDDDAASEVTTRQLLSHVAGFEGDLFTDTGTGDDCVQKYVATLADVSQLFIPGERFSYNNAAFVVLGRIIEVLRESPFDRVLRERLITPLGLRHVATDASQAIMFRAAVGHITAEDGADPVPAPVWSLVRSTAPAGAMLAMTAADLLGFARAHIEGGVASEGTRVLSAENVQAMQLRHVDLPELGLMGNAWGLGWSLYDWEGGPVIGHDGGTIGQAAFLRVVPDKGVAVAILTNGGTPFELYSTIMTRVLADLAGVTVPALPAPADPRPAMDVSRILGTYSSAVADSTVRQDDAGRIWLGQTMKGILADLGPDPAPVEMVPWRENALIPMMAKHGVHIPHHFLGDDGNGKALYMHTGRADRRISA